MLDQEDHTVWETYQPINEVFPKQKNLLLVICYTF